MTSSALEKYFVKVIRELGTDPVTGEFVDRAEQNFEITAISTQEAYRKSHFLTSIQFKGQLRRTFINGSEYFNNRF